MPESRIVLSQAAAYVACAPKSNAAAVAIDKAMDYVGSHPAYHIPPYLQDAHYDAASELGRGIGYMYAHDYKNHYAKQQYLPDEVVGEAFYELSDMGYEKQLKEHLDKIRREAE